MEAIIKNYDGVEPIIQNYNEVEVSIKNYDAVEASKITTGSRGQRKQLESSGGQCKE